MDSSRKDKAKALYTNLASSRKAFRLGRSFVELHKLWNMGLWALLIRHLRQKKDEDDPNNNKTTTTTTTTLQLCKQMGIAIKTLGLCGFWAADNINFITSTGLLDNDNDNRRDDRLLHRKYRQTLWSKRANQSYFCGSLAGLYVNLYTYIIYYRRRQRRQQQQQQQQLMNDNNKSTITAEEEEVAATTADHLKRVVTNDNEEQQQQQIIILNLVKSCADVLVFSNNAGIDFWVKYITHGRKLNEVIHCLSGMVSAAVVLYNNYPNNE